MPGTTLPNQNKRLSIYYSNILYSIIKGFTNNFFFFWPVKCVPEVQISREDNGNVIINDFKNTQYMYVDQRHC